MTSYREVLASLPTTDGMGRPIRRTDPYDRMMAKTGREGECIVYRGTRSVGYGKVGVPGVPGGKLGAHRISWEHHYGPIPDGLWVLHRCDNPPCVNIDHLFLGDSGANMRDAIAKGRKSPTRGDRNRRSPLTEDDVREIRRRSAAGERSLDIAHSFAVAQHTVKSIVARRRWAWVQ